MKADKEKRTQVSLLIQAKKWTTNIISAGFLSSDDDLEYHLTLIIFTNEEKTEIASDKAGSFIEKLKYDCKLTM
ncbi:hypothetical protein RCL_jg18238.t1 [Rhizophagus clarus]|uniref:Uncharacterized protein n=1 Tax=Rhizophagus clarus TaxID=94130 RepID=A0A8H3LFD4_9GLOM|nr:hypothetical protein RCL_jg18238.t1 [Rhizophagus clarus]